MKLKQCLEKLSPKDQKKLKENYLLKPNNTLEDLSSKIISSLLEEIFILTDEEIDTLKSLDKRKTIPRYLVQKGYVYKENNQYIIPEEVRLTTKEILTEELLDDRLLLIIEFYLSATGALKITDLIKLMKKSGANITKEKVKSLLKNGEFIKNNIIYFNDIAIKLDEQIHLVEKISGNYKVFNLKEIIKLLYLKEEYFPKKITKVLEKKVKDEEKRTFFSQIMVETAMIGIMDEDEIIEYITKDEVKLSKNEQDKIIDILEEVTDILPTWLAGGASFLEDIGEEQNREEKIKEYSKSREDSNVIDKMKTIYCYILAYVTINGVMEIDKLAEILKTNYNLNITKENILTMVKSDDYIKITKNYLNIMDNDLEVIEELIKIKDKFSDYKTIDDPETALDEFDANYDKIEKILKEYQLEGDACDTILSLFLIRELSKEELTMILDCFSIKLSTKLIKELSERLAKARKVMPTWEKNGFKSVELSQNKTSKKIGRNDKCLCGSGRKYKQCCGK